MATLAMAPRPVAVQSAAASIAQRLEQHGREQTGFAEFLRTHPGTPRSLYGITAESLEAYCDEGPLEQYQGDVAGSDLSQDLMELFCWWYELQEDAAMHLIQEAGEPLRPACQALNELMVSLGPGLIASCLYSEEPDLIARLEALRRYRSWTRTICAVVRKAWPSIDWSGLEQLV